MNMPRRNTMRRIRECLRLYFENNISQSKISHALNISRSTVQDYISRCAIASLSYEDISTLSDEDLERRLYSKPEISATSSDKNMDCSTIHKELTKSGVTLRLLWEEYKKENPDGYSYSQFCWYYQQWRKTLRVYMRQQHTAGERVYVDYSGKKPHVVNRFNGQIVEVELLVLCWGYSQYIYAEAQPSQKLKHWIMGHIRAFAFFECVPQILVPDNYKGAVKKAHRYDPDINKTYSDFAEHYGIGVIPARPRHPKDKAKVENSVLIVQRWILARLRNQVFHDIDELNRAIKRLLIELNNRKMQKLNKTRKELFEEIDKPAARALPEHAFVLKEWFNPTINFDYHIDINKRYYSVPWHYYGKKVQACLDNGVLTVFHGEKRIAIHDELTKDYSFSTVADHMPPAHRAQHDWSYEVLLKNARAIGPKMEALCKKIIGTKVHPQQGYRPCQGILRLAKTYDNVRLEAAAEMALLYNFTRVQQLSDLLKNRKDIPSEECTGTVENKDNVRGQSYYETKEGLI